MGRAAKVDKAPDVAAVPRIDGARRPGVAAAAVQCSIAVDFAPLIARFKKDGRLTLRVERLAPKARFSKGTRNNDGASWSLASDELDELTYQLAEGYDGDHTLAIRVISLTNGNTLAVLDYAVSPNAVGGSADAVAADAGPPARDDRQSDRLRTELAQAKSELAQLRQEVELAAASAPARDTDAELAAARTAAKAEMEQRLAAVAAQNTLHLQQHRDAWTSEHQARLDSASAQVQTQLAVAREAWSREAKDAFVTAERAWKNEAAAKLSKALAEAEATRSQGSDAVRRDLGEKIDALKAAVGERDGALARAQAAAAEATARAGQEAREALSKAEALWKGAEAARLAEAQAQWKAQLPAAELRGDERELDALRMQVAALRTAVAESESALAQASKVSDETRKRLESEAQHSLTKAEAAWKSAEAARLAEAQAQWREQTARTVAEACASAARPEPLSDDAELRALRDQVEALNTALVARDAAVAPLEAQPSKGAGAALAEATARYTAAEAALSKSRNRGADVTRLENELRSVRAELAKVRPDSVPVRDRIDPHGTGEPSRIRDVLKRPEQDGAPDSRRLIRDVVVVAALGIGAVLFYPEISSLIFGEPPAPVAPVVSAPVPVVPPVVVALTATVTRSAKLRAEPATSAGVIASLPRGANVTVVEERGKWTLVSSVVEAGKAAPSQGWVLSSLLKGGEASDQKSATPQHK